MSISQELATFAVDVQTQSIDPAVQREALRAAFNWVGCAVGGSDRPAVLAARKACTRTAGSGRSSVLGQGQRLDAVSAAFLNGMASSVDAFDDTDAVMMLHPSSPVAAAAFAVAQEQGSSGQQFLDALVVGMEVEYRLCRMLALPPARPRMGVYLSGLTGSPGAAAAVSRLLGLDPERAAYALAIACVAGAGQQDALSSMCCPFVPSHAARNGVMAAFMAEAGFNGSATAIEGGRGFGHVFSEQPQWQAALADLGKVWYQSSITYKPYPCGIVAHAGVDACLDIAQRAGFDAQQVAKVQARVPQLTLDLMGRHGMPADALQAQVSARHWMACALVFGCADARHTLDSVLRDPQVAAMRDRIELIPEAQLARDASAVTVHLKDGQVLECAVAHALGSFDHPMSDAQLESKFVTYAGAVIGAERAAGLSDLCWQLPALKDLDELAAMASA
jgi:2-methylcitrate dehydratase PrpD